ncbi:type II secretion system F family protein [Allonocardiopsis opalescens]|nr:type II secretion system F family protein [Allonocardiopsis opalescens]
MPTYLPTWAVLLISSAGFACVILAAWGHHLATAESRVAASAQFELQKPKKKEEEIFILYRITELLGKPFGDTVLRFFNTEQQRKLRRRIEAAGRPEGLTSVERYAQRKAGEIILYGIFALLISLSQGPIGLALLMFIFMSDMLLWQAARKRQDEIQQQLPDFLDVLAVTVGAGLSFRQALDRTTESMPGAMAEEFNIALRQMDLGTPRREAFAALRERNSNEALAKFISALQQSEELGAPLATTLNTISEDMRRSDAQFMRQKAQKLNPQVTMVSAFFLVPGLILLVIGVMIFGLNTEEGGFSQIFGGQGL